MPVSVPVLTIDGPSGSGKGTIARLAAQQLGWHMLDSGALYRVLALYVLQNKCALDNVAQIVTFAQQLPVAFRDETILLQSVDVSKKIRSEQCGDSASKIAVIPEVRAALLDRQRAFAQLPGLVADGRDMGTVVFTEAFCKIYLDASAVERAKRRFLQLKEQGYNVNLADLEADIMQRDERDKMRAVAPLRPAADAIIIDTSGMNITEVVAVVMEQARQRLS